jgi:signal transduction histidine kinase
MDQRLREEPPVEGTGKEEPRPVLRADPEPCSGVQVFGASPEHMNPVDLGLLQQPLAERRRAEEELRRRNRKLAALHAVTAAVSSSLELSEVLATLKQKLATELDIPAGAIFFRDEQADQFHLEDAWGLPPATLARLMQSPVTSYLNEQVIHDRATVLRQALRDVAPFAAVRRGGGQPGWSDCLWIQLMAKGEVQGVLALLGYARTAFPVSDYSFFHALGQEVGVAIQNARLFEQARAGHRQLRALSHRLVELQESERRLVARELHSEIGQLLAGLKLGLETRLRTQSEAGSGHPVELLMLVDELIGRVRKLSLDLRPGLLDDLGLLPALLWHFDRYTALTQVRVTFEHAGVEGRFPPAVETAAYRIVQEALTNVARHAGVQEARVRLVAQPGILVAQVEDAGKGFHHAALARDAAAGLTGMQERAQLLGGRLLVETAPGAGTRLTAELPLGEPAL